VPALDGSHAVGSNDGTLDGKLHFRIGEVAKLLGVEPSAIRHWESEFPGLTPGRTKSGQRLYTRPDVQRLMEVKRLRFDLGYTIRGARNALQGQPFDDPGPSALDLVVDDPLRASLLDLRARLVQLIEELDRESSYP